MVLPHSKTRKLDGQVYILTNDLGQRIEALRAIGLKTPSAKDHFFIELHNGIKEMIQEALPNIEVVSYDMQIMAEKVWAEAIKMQSSIQDSVVVSTCVEMATSRRGHVLEVNRIFDSQGKKIGLGPRPGHASLHSQISSIAAVIGNKPVVLAEDGAFTGETIARIVRLFRERGVSISVVVIGICFLGAVDRIKKEFEGKICVVAGFENPYEWMPDHDFIPFAPNCGRIFGWTTKEEALPHYTHDNFSYCFPYILPFGDPVEWAKIPKQYAWSFSTFCLDQAAILFRRLDKMNKRKLCLVDLLGATPRVSAPMSLGGHFLPLVNMPISDFLTETAHED
ncbi:MAG: hypothetical protein V1838_01775 [Patescibacteria group bacterium]